MPLTFVVRLLALALLLTSCRTDPRAELTGRGLPFTAAGLATAAHRGDEVAVHLFLKAGMPVDSPDEAGNTPLMHAVAEGHAQVARILLAGGADVSLGGRRGAAPPLALAVSRGHQAAVEVLLAHGARTEDREGGAGMTALGVAALKGHTAIAAALLAAGARADATDREGLTPRDIARATGHGEIVQLLASAPRGDQPAPAGRDLCATPPRWSVANPFTDSTAYWPSYALLWTSSRRDGAGAQRMLLRGPLETQAQIFLVLGAADHWRPLLAKESTRIEQTPWRSHSKGTVTSADGVTIAYVVARTAPAVLDRRTDVTYLFGTADLGPRVLIVDAGGATDTFDPDVVLRCLRSFTIKGRNV